MSLIYLRNTLAGYMLLYDLLGEYNINRNVLNFVDQYLHAAKDFCNTTDDS